MVVRRDRQSILQAIELARQLLLLSYMLRRLAPLLLLAGLSRAAVAENDTDTEPVCGNGHLEGNEECDDGNLRDHDHCDAQCHIEPLWGCGDLVLSTAEECDDDGALCMPTCQVDSY